MHHIATYVRDLTSRPSPRGVAMRRLDSGAGSCQILQQRVTAIRLFVGAGVIMGLLWGAYHFSIIYWSGNPKRTVPAVHAARGSPDSMCHGHHPGLSGLKPSSGDPPAISP